MVLFKQLNYNKLQNVFDKFIFLEKDIGVDPKIIQDIIKNCDKNGDGMIDYKEFLSNVSQLG